jgi:hypothetical protein
MVSFIDSDGIRHQTAVDAETLYEAAVQAVRNFREHGCPPAPASVLEIEVHPPSVTHQLTLLKVQGWLESSAKSPHDRITKERLKGLLST